MKHYTSVIFSASSVTTGIEGRQRHIINKCLLSEAGLKIGTPEVSVLDAGTVTVVGNNYDNG